MRSVSVSSCRCCMSCVHHVAVLNAAFYMTCYKYHGWSGPGEH